MFWMFWIMILIVIVWLVLSLKIVGPEEMAVKVIFGKPISFCDSGFRFVPFLPRLKCYLQRYPKKTYNFDYPAREVITRTGEYKGTFYGSQVLKVDSVVYLNFPREERSEATGDDLKKIETDKKRIEKTHPLIKILRAQVPIEEEKLKNWTEEAVVGALRVAFGKITWGQATRDIKEVTKETENVFKAADGTLIRAGFSVKGIQLVVAEITLPLALQQAMPVVDQQRLEAEAAPFEAQQRAEETIGTVIQMMVISTGEKPENIRAQIKKSTKLTKEFRELCQDLICRRMAIDGNSYLDIRVTGAEGTEKSLLELLAAWKRMPLGKSKQDNQKTEEENIKKGKETHEAVEKVRQQDEEF